MSEDISKPTCSVNGRALMRRVVWGRGGREPQVTLRPVTASLDFVVHDYPPPPDLSLFFLFILFFPRKGLTVAPNLYYLSPHWRSSSLTSDLALGLSRAGSSFTQWTEHFTVPILFHPATEALTPHLPPDLLICAFLAKPQQSPSHTS